MKKFIILLIGLLLVCSCCENTTPQQRQKARYENLSKAYQNNADLIELTFKDEHGENRTHQFVVTHYTEYKNGMAHWPDCKYCKNRF